MGQSLSWVKKCSELQRNSDDKKIIAACPFVFMSLSFIHFLFRVCRFVVPRLEKEQISFPWGSIWATPGESYMCVFCKYGKMESLLLIQICGVDLLFPLKPMWTALIYGKKVTFNNKIAHGKRENGNSLLTAGMLSFQCFYVLRAVESWIWKSCGIWSGECVCNPLTPPQGVETTSSGGSQGYFQPADISDSLW